jgi:hypothetical protein
MPQFRAQVLQLLSFSCGNTTLACRVFSAGRHRECLQHHGAPFSTNHFQKVFR